MRPDGETHAMVCDRVVRVAGICVLYARVGTSANATGGGTVSVRRKEAGRWAQERRGGPGVTGEGIIRIRVGES